MSSQSHVIDNDDDVIDRDVVTYNDVIDRDVVTYNDVIDRDVVTYNVIEVCS